jgi:hypothetical protein
VPNGRPDDDGRDRRNRRHSDVDTCDHLDDGPVDLLPLKQFAHQLSKGRNVPTGSCERGRSSRCHEHPPADRLPLRVVGIEKTCRRPAMNLRGQLPPQITRILYAGLKSHSSIGKMHMCGIARKQHAALAISLGLTAGICSPRHPSRFAHGKFGADDTGESLLKLVQGHRQVTINLRLIPFDSGDPSDFGVDWHDGKVAGRGSRYTETRLMQVGAVWSAIPAFT